MVGITIWYDVLLGNDYYYPDGIYYYWWDGIYYYYADGNGSDYR